MSNHRHLVRSRVYVTAGRPSVCLSVCPITRPLHSVATGLLLCARLQEISIDCCTAGGQQQRRRSTALSSECEQCHVISRRRKLNTDLVTKPLRISLLIFFTETQQQETASTFDTCPPGRCIRNESVPIQLAQCWFPRLAISNAKI